MQTDHRHVSERTASERLDLRVGELVEVRSEQEILATLDEHGRLDGMPFMPELLQFAGQRLRVDKRAIKACDTIGTATLHAETRTEPAGSSEPIYACQATEMPKAAPTHLRGFDLGQYTRDVTSGNARPLPMLRSLLILVFNKFQSLNRRLLPRLLLVHGGASYPFIDGKVRGRTPKETFDLQAGELVEVKSAEEIFETLDRTGSNRGVRFDGEMLKYCGRRARVLRRVDQIINEKTGRMLRLPGDCILLEGVICTGDYHQFCPRGIYPYWREIWLRRVQ